MLSQAEKGPSKPSCSVHIKNLDATIDTDGLQETFSVFGNIVSCEVALTEEGKSKGFGYVEFDSQAAVELAIEKVDGMSVNDKKLVVSAYRRDKAAATSGGSIFVKNLDRSVDNKALYNTFSSFGVIMSCMVAVDENSVSKGFGFVHYDCAEAADLAISKVNGMMWNDKKVSVTKWKSREERSEKGNTFEGVNLYVKYLDDEINTPKLCEIFSKFGQITSAKVMEDEKGNSRGFGFVCFMNAEEATKAVAEMNGRIVISKPLYVALAQRKDERRAFLETQYKQRAPAPQMQPMPMQMPPPQAPPMHQVYHQQPQPMFIQQGQPTSMYAPPTLRPVWQQPQPVRLGSFYPTTFQPVQRVVSPPVVPQSVPNAMPQDVHNMSPQPINGPFYWWSPGPNTGQHPPS